MGKKKPPADNARGQEPWGVDKTGAAWLRPYLLLLAAEKFNLVGGNAGKPGQRPDISDRRLPLIAVLQPPLDIVGQPTELHHLVARHHSAP
jgi:hypothetical protein